MGQRTKRDVKPTHWQKLIPKFARSTVRMAALALRALGAPPEGIAEARWPGRLEHVSPNPDIILDGAHNPAGARALARYLTRFYPGRRRWLIYGAMRDKAIEEIAGILFPLADELIFTAPASDRALRPEALLERPEVDPPCGWERRGPQPAAVQQWMRFSSAPWRASSSFWLSNSSSTVIGRRFFPTRRRAFAA